MHYLTPPGISVDLINLLESLVNIRHSRYEGSPIFDGAASRFPIKWVPPTVMIIARAPGFLENLKKVDCPFIILLLSESLGEKSEAHSIMGI